MTIVPFLHKVNAVILNPLLQVLFAVAALYFLYAIIRLVRADGSDKAEARNAVLWSVVGIFIIMSVYGIINLITTSFEIQPNTGTDFIHQ